MTEEDITKIQVTKGSEGMSFECREILHTYQVGNTQEYHSLKGPKAASWIRGALRGQMVPVFRSVFGQNWANTYLLAFDSESIVLR